MAGKAGAAVYNTPRWRRIRRAVLDAAGWRCASCRGYGNEVHHKVRIVDGGEPWDRSNLTVRCRACHLDEHHPDPDARAWHRLTVEVMKSPAGATHYLARGV